MKITSIGANAFFIAVFVCHFAASQARADSILNGDFETGDLTGWTVFTTPNGALGGPEHPGVVLFDTNNDSFESFAAQFRVGLIVPMAGAAGGGGIFQSVELSSGFFAIIVDIAVSHTLSTGPNLAAGTFDLIFDGIFVASHDFGSIVSGETEHSTLVANLGPVAAGPHEIRIQMTRPLLQSAGARGTPFQYVDEVRLSSVPEPFALVLLAWGLAGLAAVRHNIRKQPQI